ncbi:hypothetical protein [Clostridium magnum]|uniref:hypothetical protein n=1 Tax=Clostridium magnum TaxID=33954 RepID=UPI00091A6A7C|nr:hypothetical protein [Clostridium magnum]SHJ62649.1 hypothetical protein SAMN02745944_06254 [Clostridium magnum DSM 2767]
MSAGRRIIYDTVTGKIVYDMGEIVGEGILPREPFNSLDYVDLEVGQDADSFKRVSQYHIDPATKTVVFDVLREPVLTEAEQIAQLQQDLLIAQGVI